MRYLWGLDINKDLVDALVVWSEFLVGERKVDEWGPSAAAYFLQSEGFGLPDRPLETATLTRLDVLASSAASLKAAMNGPNPGPAVVKRLGAFARVMSEVSKDYFEKALDIRLEIDNPADNPKQTSDALAPPTNTLADVIEVTANEYEKPGDLLDAAGHGLAGYYNSVPAEASNNYDKIPDELTRKTVDQNVYDVVGRDIVGQEGAGYFRPPPPETEFENMREAAGGRK